MIQTHYSASNAMSYSTPEMGAAASQRQLEAAKEHREAYGTSLLTKLDQQGYDAFINATKHLSQADTKLAAQTMERAAAVSAANKYATDHEIDMTTDMSIVYAFFEHYQDVVTSDQIKHLLNTRLMDAPTIQGESFNSEAFFDDYLAQLGSLNRKLDILV